MLQWKMASSGAGVLNGGDFAPEGMFGNEMCEDIFGYCNWGEVLLSISRERPRVPLNTLQCIGQPQQRSTSSKRHRARRSIRTGNSSSPWSG